MPILPAIDRLKNYSKDDFDFTLINTQNRTLKYRPPDDDIEHDQLLDSLADELRSSTQAYIHDQFSQSISDSVFETMTESKQPRTRDSLKQMIEGACSDCDMIGIADVNKFVRHFTELHAFCNERKSQLPKNKNESVENRIVPMTQDKYIGTAKHVFNMHHM